MTGDIEAAGDLISGALLARAVGAAGAGHGGRPPLCLNCGTRLMGPHCHRCGQSGDVHRTVGAIGHEIAHGVFHIEGKVWRTLPMLVLHPGRLTRRYIDGERVRFVSPLALFLFMVFLLFATISWVGGDIDSALAPSPAREARVAEQLTAAKAQVAKAEAARAAALADHRQTEEIDDRLAALRAGVGAAEAAQSGLWGQHGHVTVKRIMTGWRRLDDGVDRAQRNPGLALYKLQSSAYKYSWLLIPLSTPFVALLFVWRRRFGLYDHAVFVTYSLCFMMLLAATMSLIGAAGLAGDWLPFAILVIPPVHIFAQLRGTYGLRRRSALWRTLALVGFAFVALLGFTTLLLVHGLTD